MEDAMDKAILVDGKVVEADLMTWAKWFEAKKDGRNVGKDEFGDVRVSTVFLGLNHGYGNGPALWFETMIFGGAHDEYQERYETLEEAKMGHAKACELVLGERAK